MPKNTLIKTVDDYFVAFFPDKKANNEVFKYNFKDREFDEFFVENTDNGSRIVIKTKDFYKPEFVRHNSIITVKAVFKPKKKSIKSKKTVQAVVPSALVAVPFYISPTIFLKKNINGTSSYDESLFFTGIKFFANRNYTYAAQFFDEIIKKYPSSDFYVSSYFLLGDCYKNMKQYQKALDVYQKAIELSAKNDTVAQTLFSMADIYKKMGFYSRVRRIYASIVKDYATTKWSQKAQYLIAKSYYDEKMYNKALNILLNIGKNSTYHSLSMLLAAEIFIKENNDAKAVLAYYSMSNKLKDIDIAQYYKELIDTAEALCRFNDFNGADDIFKYVESYHNEDVFESVYLGEMRCDLNRGSYDDLNNKGEYIVKNSKNRAFVKEAKKLMDEAKLQKGNVNKNTINEILRKYANDPEVASLALYVFARKNYRQNNYKETLNYLLKLKRLYPKSIYNAKAKNFAKVCIDKLLEDFYKYPDKEKLEFIYNSVVTLGAYDANMCRLALALAVMNKIDKMHAILPHIKDKNCKGSLYAKYYIETGEYKKALEFAGNIEGVEPYVYYVDIVVGDVNFFKGAYKKAVELYKQALAIKNELVKEYIYLKMANAMYLDKNYENSLKYLNNIKMKVFENAADYIKATDLYSMNRYKKAIAVFKLLSNSLDYQERALFYISISYLKIGDKKEAETYFKKLKDRYPNSDYIKALKVLL